MEDQEIIGLFFERNETALSEISRRYRRLYDSVIHRILSDDSDTEECSNDVLLAAWNSIPPHRPERLAPYLCALAKRIAVDRLRHNTREKRNPGYVLMLSELEECLSDEEPMAPENDGEEIREALNRFLRGLDTESRVLFLRRYVYSDTTAELSERFGLKENTVCAKLIRTRKKLKQFLTKEGIAL